MCTWNKTHLHVYPILQKYKKHYNWCISSISNTMYLIYNLIILDSFMISDDAKLIKGNYGNEGYYRVNYSYDPESWKAIAAQLNNDHEVIEAYRYNYMYYHTNTTVFYLVVRINVVINGLIGTYISLLTTSGNVHFYYFHKDLV